jgi:asparagine synthase (glutamine-hydrolysing)
MTDPVRASPVTDAAPVLDDLEVASGIVVGLEPRAGEAPVAKPGPRRGAADTARAALEEVVAGYLAAGPVAVSFSGGRDSSAVLALTAYVARREALPLPVPVTFRFPGVASTEESEWQVAVMEHLGLHDWVRLDLDDELDLLGDMATTCLRRHGLLWPPNTYFHLPLFRAARGATVLTGLDGDGLFGTWRWRHAQAVLHRRVAAGWRDVPRIGFALAPPALRRAALAHRGTYVPEWLTPEAGRRFVERTLTFMASEPRRWDRRARWHARARALHLAATNLALVAEDAGARVAHPLLDPRVVSALATEGGAAGLGGRTDIMRHLFGDLLPESVVARETKAVFGAAVWHAHTRAFVDEWDGGGLDPQVVRPDALRAAWHRDLVPFTAWTALHAVWLSTQDG